MWPMHPNVLVVSCLVSPATMARCSTNETSRAFEQCCISSISWLFLGRIEPICLYILDALQHAGAGDSSNIHHTNLVAEGHDHRPPSSFLNLVPARSSAVAVADFTKPLMLQAVLKTCLLWKEWEYDMSRSAILAHQGKWGPINRSLGDDTCCKTHVHLFMLWNVSHQIK